MGNTVFIFGAGSTAYLGIPTTEQQNKLLPEISGGLLGKLKIILDRNFGENNYTINDVYNVIDSNLLLHSALQSGETKIESYELEKCKRDLITFLFTGILDKTREAVGKKDYQKLVSFYRALAEKELEEKTTAASDFQKREVFIAPYSIINFNWDLFSLLPIIEANSKANHTNDHYLPTRRNPQLRIYTDFNCEFAAKAKNGENEYWYPFTESAAFITNSLKYDTTRRVLLTKCFFPHGAMNFFKCPACAKHSYYLGDLTVASVSLEIKYDVTSPLYKCPYCQAEISSLDFDVLTQSNFKVRNSFLEETRLSMTEQLKKAERLVFVGYSMPNDDVDYITLFKSLRENVKEVFVVLYDKNAKNKFVSYTSLSSDFQNKVGNFNNAFGDKAKYNFAGFPNAGNEILKVIV